MKDLALSSTWSITLHDPSSIDQAFATLGQFNTISGFWQLYNEAIVEKNIIEVLPPRVNITIYRDNNCDLTDPIKQWHGEWNIKLQHQTNPINIYQKLVLLIIGEQLTNKIRGLVLQRIPIENSKKLDFSVSIFTDCKDPQLDIKNILLSNDVIDLDDCIHKMAVFTPFKIIHIPRSEQNHNSEQKEPEEISIDESTHYIKYSMASLMEYSKLIETTNLKYLNEPSSVTKISIQNTDILPDFKHREIILKLFGEHKHAYNLSVAKDEQSISDKMQQILFAEGCVVCMQPTLHSPYTKDEEQKSFSPPNEEKEYYIKDSDSFIIAQCPCLGCQHIIHCECALGAGDSVMLRGKHCSNFFQTIDLSSLSNAEIETEIGYDLNTENLTGKTYYFSFKINHLISNQKSVSPHWPIKVPSYFQLKNGHKQQQCLQVFFDHTELQICRGTIQIAIVAEYANNTDSEGNIFMHSANFDIPTPSNEEIMASKCSHKLYQLLYVDPSTQNELIVNVNMKLKPKYELHILSLRYNIIALDTNTNSVNLSVAPYICGSPLPTQIGYSEMTSPPPMIGSTTNYYSPMLSCAMPTPVQLPLPLALQMPLASVDYNNNNHNSTDFLMLPQPCTPAQNLHLSHSPTQLYHYACTELGANYFTNKMRNPAYFGMFFEKLKKFFPLLMVNCTGHTVCRAMYSQSHCQLSDKIVLLNSLIPNFSAIASNRQGSFALICVMSSMATNTEIEVIKQAFVAIINKRTIANKSENQKSEFDDIILSQSGYHVIKKFIGFGYPHFSCIIEGIALDFDKYATHHYGVPIIRSILDTISSNDHLVQQYSNWLSLFAQHTLGLVCNQYGNYVIQQLLEISPTAVSDAIKELMLGSYSQYSKHKFASNVVEKCLKHSLCEAKERLLLFKAKNENENEKQSIVPFTNWTSVIIGELLLDAKILINHKYGNYCLQTALSVCIESSSFNKDSAKLLKQFVGVTRPLLHMLRLNVRKKWQQLLVSATNSVIYNNHILHSG